MPHHSRHSSSPTPADHPLMQAAIAAIMELPPDQLLGMILVHTKIMSIPERPRTARLKEFMPEASDREIAAMVGVDRTTLYNWPEYRETKAMLKRVYTLRWGTVDGDGNLEAWA